MLGGVVLEAFQQRLLMAGIQVDEFDADAVTALGAELVAVHHLAQHPQRLGIAAPDGDAPTSWITRAEPGVGDEIMSRFEVMSVDTGNPPGTLLLRVLAGATPRQVRLELSAQGAPLEV
ncbi:MAG TPA: hypothetical protein PLY66_12745, partial [Acidobacteriota bacterium]|nr:hypothetical protein [Acidobacteriota bacterium]